MELSQQDFVSTSEVPLVNEPLETFEALLDAATRREKELQAQLDDAHAEIADEHRRRDLRRAELLKELEELHRAPGGPLEGDSAPVIDFGPTQRNISRRMELREVKNVVLEEEREMRLEVAALETEVSELNSYASSKAAAAEREAKKAASVSAMVEQLTTLRNAAVYERSHRRQAVAEARRAAQSQYESTVLRQQSEIATLEGKIRALARVHESLQNAIFHHGVTATSTSSSSSSISAVANLEDQLRSSLVSSGTSPPRGSRIVLPGYVLQSDESLGRNQSSAVMYLRDDPNL